MTPYEWGNLFRALALWAWATALLLLWAWATRGWR